MEKTFSVIMPVWNRAGIVAKAIESVLAQNFKDYELHIVDDGSQDELAKVVRPYLSENVIFHRIPHSRAGAARNFALKRARGRYIAYLDSDNTWHPDFLSKMCRALHRSTPPKEAAYCMSQIYKRNQETGKICRDSELGRKFNFNKLILTNYIDMSNFVHSKRCFEELGGFDEELKRRNDWDFIIKITAKYKPVFVRRILVDYYHGIVPNAISLTQDRYEPKAVITERYIQYNKRNVSLVHDTIKYKWKNVPQKKYLNWVKMHKADDVDTKDFTAPGFPYILQIEPTNKCNLSCTSCPAAVDNYELNRKRQNMTLNEFKDIIDDMQDYLLFAVLWNWGEPFINPELPDMIRYAAQKDIKTVTSTNAQFLHNKAYLKRILTSGLTTLIVAIDSLDEENYQKYRKGGNLTKAMKGLRDLVDLKKQLNSKTLIHWRMVIMKSNEHELPEMKRLAKKLKVDIFSVKSVNPSQATEFKDEEIIPRNPKYQRYVYKKGTYERVRINDPCQKVWTVSTILSNGDVVACCFDYSAELKVGNVFEQPFTEIWDSPAYQELRKRIYCERDAVPKCKNCDIYFKLASNRRIIETYDFNMGLKESFIDNGKRIAKQWLPDKVIKTMRQRIETVF